MENKTMEKGTDKGMISITDTSDHNTCLFRGVCDCSTDTSDISEEDIKDYFVKKVIDPALIHQVAEEGAKDQDDMLARAKDTSDWEERFVKFIYDAVTTGDEEKDKRLVLDFIATELEKVRTEAITQERTKITAELSVRDAKVKAAGVKEWIEKNHPIVDFKCSEHKDPIPTCLECLLRDQKDAYDEGYSAGKVAERARLVALAEGMKKRFRGNMSETKEGINGHNAALSAFISKTKE